MIKFLHKLGFHHWKFHHKKEGWYYYECTECDTLECTFNRLYIFKYLFKWKNPINYIDWNYLKVKGKIL